MLNTIVELAALHEKATKGTWVTKPHPLCDDNHVVAVFGALPYTVFLAENIRDEDAALIVAMRNALPELLAGYATALARVTQEQQRSRDAETAHARSQDALKKAEAERDVLAWALQERHQQCPPGYIRNCPGITGNNECVGCWLKWAAQEAAKRESEV